MKIIKWSLIIASSVLITSCGALQPAETTSSATSQTEVSDKELQKPDWMSLQRYHITDTEIVIFGQSLSADSSKAVHQAKQNAIASFSILLRDLEYNEDSDILSKLTAAQQAASGDIPGVIEVDISSYRDFYIVYVKSQILRD